MLQSNEMCVAASRGDLDRVKQLHEDGAHINHTLHGSSALMKAAWMGHSEMLEFLLEKGADVNLTDSGSASALLVAVYKGHLEVAILLVEKGAALDQADNGGLTPLMKATANGHLEMVALLLEKGAIANLAGGLGHFKRTPLMEAAMMGFYEITALLLENGAAADHPDINGLTPLITAAACGY